MSFKEKFINYSSITTFLLIYLALKSTKGIDLTDEMQYYLQIKSLIEAGILFQNDLFFQQTVYIIFYPFFWGLNALFGYEGFIFTGRILFAFLILFFFIFCVHSLRKSEFEPKFIPLTALSMSVALVGLNIFAINYNSFSLFLLGLFLLQFLNWGKHSKTNIQLMPLLAIFSNPFLASAMAITIWIRFLADKDLGLIKKSLYLNGLGLMACALLIFQFSDLNVLIQSIEFTKEFSIGSAIFSSTYQILTLISLPIFYVLIKILMEKNNVYKIFLLVAFSNLEISFSFLHIIFGVQFLLIKLIALIIFYLSLHIYSLKRCQDNLTKQTIKWLALSTFIFCIFSLCVNRFI